MASPKMFGLKPYESPPPARRLRMFGLKPYESPPPARRLRMFGLKPYVPTDERDPEEDYEDIDEELERLFAPEDVDDENVRLFFDLLETEDDKETQERMAEDIVRIITESAKRRGTINLEQMLLKEENIQLPNEEPKQLVSEVSRILNTEVEDQNDRDKVARTLVDMYGLFNRLEKYATTDAEIKENLIDSEPQIRVILEILPNRITERFIRLLERISETLFPRVEATSKTFLVQTTEEEDIEYESAEDEEPSYLIEDDPTLPTDRTILWLPDTTRSQKRVPWVESVIDRDSASEVRYATYQLTDDALKGAKELVVVFKSDNKPNEKSGLRLNKLSKSWFVRDDPEDRLTVRMRAVALLKRISDDVKIRVVFVTNLEKGLDKVGAIDPFEQPFSTDMIESDFVVERDLFGDKDNLSVTNVYVFDNKVQMVDPSLVSPIKGLKIHESQLEKEVEYDPEFFIERSTGPGESSLLTEMTELATPTQKSASEFRFKLVFDRHLFQAESVNDLNAVVNLFKDQANVGDFGDGNEYEYTLYVVPGDSDTPSDHREFYEANGTKAILVLYEDYPEDVSQKLKFWESNLKARFPFERIGVWGLVNYAKDNAKFVVKSRTFDTYDPQNSPLSVEVSFIHTWMRTEAESRGDLEPIF